MTDNTNDAEKTPKPRAARKPRKVAEAAAPVPGEEETGRVEKTPKPRAPRKPRKVAEAAAPVPVSGEEEAERVERVEKIEVVAEDSERAAPDSEPRAEQAERDARAAWFERAERTRREERTGWTPWTWPGEREEPVGGEERAERAEGGKDPLGTAAEEALKLFDTLQQKATRELRKNLIKGTMTGFGSAFSGGGRGRERDVWEEAVSEHEEYICRACPVCRAMAAQRESGTAVTDHLMQAGTELFAAFKSAVDGLGKPASGQRAREREDTPVEHIDLG